MRNLAKMVKNQFFPSQHFHLPHFIENKHIMGRDEKQKALRPFFPL